MRRSFVSKFRTAIGRAALVGIVIVIIIIIAVGGYAALNLSKGTSSSSASSSSNATTGGSSSTISTGATKSAVVPSSLTYETLQTIQYLDPQVSYDIYGASVQQQVYEPLLWYAGSNGSAAVPWLASNYSVSSDQKTMTLNLRNNVTFADGERLNSSAVYFSLNRLLIMDGSTPTSHGTQASWILQQLENKNLSTFFSGPQNYSQKWASAVIGQNFVQITGPYQVVLHIQNPNSALPYLIANLWANIVAVDYTMQKDLAMWGQSSMGYSLPYPTASGNATNMMNQYLDDYVATCNSGVTPKGCAATYLDMSQGGSLGGTGPYVIQSVDPSTNDIVLQKNSHYWGGPDHTTAQIPKIEFKYVPLQTDRTIDVTNAARSGQAMVIDVTSDHLYDVADRNAWLSTGKLQSTIPGLTIYGTYSQYATLFDQFATNVTNSQTGTFYQFQPFADLRMRLAFADAVNLTSINENVNNKLGTVANEVIPPGLPPNGAYNASLTPRYSYNLTAVQNLLLSAMTNPIKSFAFENGTAAPAGYFNNTFGCLTLQPPDSTHPGGSCKSPVGQTITLVYGTGATVDQAIYNQIAGAIENVSLTYNMGLNVVVQPLPAGQMETQAFAGQVYAWAESVFGWYDDYPWSIDFLGPIMAPGGIYTAPAGWNLTQMNVYWKQALAASATGNLPALVRATNQMAALGNQEVMDLWTFYPAITTVMTSNVQGFFFNPGLYTTGEPVYFASLY